MRPVPTTDPATPRPTHTADVVVVGAGIAGSSAAWHLARTGLQVLLLEQGEQPLAEASAQNAGMLRRFALTTEERDLACRTFELVTGDLPNDLATALGGVEPFRRTGAVLALAEPDDGRYAAVADDLRRRGVRVEEPSPATLAAHAPALRDAALRRAWWLPEEGLLDAWTLGQAFLRAATARGAELRLGCQVTSLWLDDGGLRGVHTADGPVAAPRVLLAAGAWAERLVLGAGLERRLEPRARHLLQSAEHPLSSNDHPWCWLDDVGLYVRPEAGGFLVSPCDETVRYPEPGPGSARGIEELGRALATDKLRRHLPALAELRLTGGWTGLRTFTADRHTLHGADPEVDGLLWMGGLGGWGISCGFALGEQLAAIVTAGA